MAGVLQPDGTYCHTKNCRKHSVPVNNVVDVNIDVDSAVLPVPDVSWTGKAPIVVEKIKFSQPVENVELHDGVEYDFDYHGCNGCTDSICRDSTYEGLRIESVHVESALRGIYNIGFREPIPVDLLDNFINAGGDDLENYEVSTRMGYYGEEVVVTPSDHLINNLQKHYWGYENASDVNNVLDYLRSKGFVTQGKNPVEAVVDSNSRMKNLSSVRYISNKIVDLDQIEVNERQLGKAVQRSPETVHDYWKHRDSGSKNEQKIYGILRYVNGRYVVVEGYDHIKDALNPVGGKRPKKQASFIIVS